MESQPGFVSVWFVDQKPGSPSSRFTQSDRMEVEAVEPRDFPLILFEANGFSLKMHILSLHFEVFKVFKFNPVQGAW